MRKTDDGHVYKTRLLERGKLVWSDCTRPVLFYEELPQEIRQAREELDAQLHKTRRAGNWGIAGFLLLNVCMIFFGLTTDPSSFEQGTRTAMASIFSFALVVSIFFIYRGFFAENRLRGEALDLYRTLRRRHGIRADAAIVDGEPREIELGESIQEIICIN